MKAITPHPTASASQTIADTAMKTPILVVTNDKWGCPAVVFDGQCMVSLFPSLDYAGVYNDKFVELEKRFWSENTEIAKYWSNLGILRTVDGDYYRYDARGGCKFLRGSLDTDIIDWSSDPEDEADEGVRDTIWTAFHEIAGNYDYPSAASLGNGQTDSVRSIVEEALDIVDRRIMHECDDVIATLQEWGLVKAAAQVATDIADGSTDKYLLCTTTDGDEYIRIDSHDQGERLIIRKEDADTGDLWYYRDETGLEGGAQ